MTTTMPNTCARKKSARAKSARASGRGRAGEGERASEGHTKERRRGRGSLGRPPPVPGRRRGRAGWLGPAAGRSKQNKRDAPQLRHSSQNLRKSILSLFFSFPPPAPPTPFFLRINQSGASVVATYPYFWGMKCGSSWMKVGHIR
jgi:hypothetical protein